MSKTHVTAKNILKLKIGTKKDPTNHEDKGVVEKKEVVANLTIPK